MAIYTAVKYFRYMLEGREFAVITDHKPLTYAFNQDSLHSSPRQARQLEYIGQFTTDIRHVAGKENVVIDTLSRIESIQKAINLTKLAEAQKEDQELQETINAELGIKLKKIKIPGTTVELYCDISTPIERPYVTRPYKKQVFLLDLAHPRSQGKIYLAAVRLARHTKRL